MSKSKYFMFRSRFSVLLVCISAFLFSPIGIAGKDSLPIEIRFKNDSINSINKSLSNFNSLKEFAKLRAANKCVSNASDKIINILKSKNVQNELMNVKNLTQPGELNLSFSTNKFLKKSEMCAPNGFKVAFEVDFENSERECRFENYSVGIDFSKNSFETNSFEKEFLESLSSLKVSTSKIITERNQCLEKMRENRKEFTKSFSYAESFFLNVGMYPNEKQSITPSNILDKFDAFGSSGLSLTTVDEFGSIQSNHMSIYGASEELKNLSKTNHCFTKVLTNLNQLYRENKDMRSYLASVASAQNASYLRLLLIFSKGKDPIPDSNYLPLCDFANVGLDIAINDFVVWNGGLFKEKMNPWIDSNTYNFNIEVLKKIAKIRVEEYSKYTLTQKNESNQNPTSWKRDLEEIQKKDRFFRGIQLRKNK